MFVSLRRRARWVSRSSEYEVLRIAQLPIWRRFPLMTESALTVMPEAKAKIPQFSPFALTVPVVSVPPFKVKL